MRALFVAVVVVAVGYLGWVIFRETAHSTTALPVSKNEATPAPVATTLVAQTAPAPSETTTTQVAPPGVFYAIERVSVQTETGVKALTPGEEVRLMYRYKNGTMLVTNGRDEFVVKASALTKNRGELLKSTQR